MPEKEKRCLMHYLFLFDGHDCTIAKIYDDNSFEIVLKEKSFVGNKHRQGGQSSQRFERERNNQLKHWFKKCMGWLNDIQDPVVVGCHLMYQNRIDTRANVVRVFCSEYFDFSGVQQFVNRLKPL